MNEIINSIMEELSSPKRKSKGQDRKKNYHKITISINEKDKKSVLEYAEKNDITVSALIKNLLKERKIIQ